MITEYKLEIDADSIAYVYFETIEGAVSSFIVKLLAYFDGEWHELIRYDSGHECPHKDILDHKGEIVRKVWYDFLDNSQALTMAIADIKDNYEFYKERYYKWLKG